MGKAALRKKRLNVRALCPGFTPKLPSRIYGEGTSVKSAAMRVFRQRSHVGEVAIALLVVEAVADREPVRNLEADVANGKIDAPPLGLREQGADLDRLRASRLEVPEQVVKGEAGVDDVLDDQDLPPGDRRVEVLEDADDARGVGR